MLRIATRKVRQRLFVEGSAQACLSIDGGLIKEQQNDDRESSVIKQKTSRLFCTNLHKSSWQILAHGSPNLAKNWSSQRSLQTGPGEPTQPSSNSHKEQLLKDAASIIQRIDAAHFTEVLQHEAQTKWNLEYDEFERLCLECGAATGKEDAQQICDALDRSGVVLRIKNLVYLRPLEVAEILYKALPDTAEEVRTRLEQLKSEASPLLAKKASIDAHANRYARTILWTGFAVFTAQMILYARLTFWELSWDVMEPVTYFTSATFAVLAYIYCMWHNEEFGILSARKRIHSNVQAKKYAENGLDTSKLDFLLHRINRLEATISPNGEVKLHKYRQTENGATENSKKGRNRAPMDDPTGTTSVGTS